MIRSIPRVATGMFCVAILATTLLAGQERNPFPVNGSYGKGFIKPAGTQAELNAAVISCFDRYQKKYLKESELHPGTYYIRQGFPAGSKTEIADPVTGDVADGQGQKMSAITTSEAMGYGMMIFALMAGADVPNAVYPNNDEKAVFDGLFKFTRNYPSYPDDNLFSWYVGKNEVGPKGGDADAATDGDMDIAYALLLADRQWGSDGEINYKEEAIKIIKVLKQETISSIYRIRPGVKASFKNETTSRPSDWILEHFRAFAKVTNDPAWDKAVVEVYNVLNDLSKFNKMTGLVPGYVTNDPAIPDVDGGGNGGDGGEPSAYEYNACRFPFRMAVDVAFNGKDASKSRVALTKLMDWALVKTKGKAADFQSGYNITTGVVLPESKYDDICFIGPITCGSIINAKYQPLLDSCWGYILDTVNNPASDVYSYGLQTMTLVFVTGNWWNPMADNRKMSTVVPAQTFALGTNRENMTMESK